MGKVDDIPQDVWDAALGLAETCAFDGYTVRKETNLTDAWAVVDELNAVLIARAILAEREACAAKIAEHAEGERALQHAAREAKDRRDTLIHMYAAQGLEQLAAAIRKGSD